MNREYFRILLYGGDTLIGIEEFIQRNQIEFVSHTVFKKMLIDEALRPRIASYFI